MSIEMQDIKYMKDNFPLMYLYCRWHILYPAKSNRDFPPLLLQNENCYIHISTEYISESGIQICIQSEQQCYSSSSFQVLNKELLQAVTNSSPSEI